MKAAHREKRLPAVEVPHRYREGDITFEEFLESVPDGVKADLLDGVIYTASPDNVEAGGLTSWLSRVLGGYAERLDLGEVYLLRVCYRIGPKRGPEPDLGFVPKELEAKRRFGYIDAPPALAIEIVSPESVERDYVRKRMIYEEAGVQEYWIIDPGARRVIFLRLHGKRYKAVKPVKHIFRSEVLPGFSIDVRWLLSADRPKSYEILEDLLGD
jgi:Uma2 family endonuclease